MNRSFGGKPVGLRAEKLGIFLDRINKIERIKRISQIRVSCSLTSYLRLSA
jgi:hypothetical protein